MVGTGRETQAPEVFLKIHIAEDDYYMARDGRLTHGIESIAGTPDFFSGFLVDALEPGPPNAPGLPKTPEVDFIHRALVSLKATKTVVHLQISGWFSTEDIDRTRGLLGHASRLTGFLAARGFADRSIRLFDVVDTIYNDALVVLSESRVRPDISKTESERLSSRSVRPSITDGSNLNLVLFNLKNSRREHERKAYARIKEEFETLLKPYMLDVNRTGP